MRKTPLQLVSEALADQAREYAAEYKCSLMDAIADRDYPVSYEEAKATLILLNIEPTEENICLCHPSSDAAIEQFKIDEYDYYRDLS